MTGGPGRRDVQHLLVVPDRAGHQVLQPVRPAKPDRLGDRPAVAIVQLHQQPGEHLGAGLPGLPPGEAPGDPAQQVRQQRGPGLIGYRGSSDCRVLVVSHKPIMIAAAAPLRGPLTCASNPTVTNYSCRIRTTFDISYQQVNLEHDRRVFSPGESAETQTIKAWSLVISILRL